MKLSNLTERKVTQRNIEDARKHLVLDMGYQTSPGFTSSLMQVYIITDIPRISNDKLQQLYNLSFEHGINDDWAPELKRLPYGYLDNVDPTGFRVRTMKWKEFVVHMKRQFPVTDDFDR